MTQNTNAYLSLGQTRQNSQNNFKFTNRADPFKQRAVYKDDSSEESIQDKKSVYFIEPNMIVI